MKNIKNKMKNPKNTIINDNWSIPYQNWGTEEPQEEPQAETISHARRRKTECLIRENRNIYRKAFSETQLLDAVGFDFQDGQSYHCITAGDVDSLSFLKVVIRQQPLDYCLFSTWCMAADDILQFDEWLSDKKIIKLDAYLGEIFPGSYRFEWQSLNNIFAKHKCGRIAFFKNHSKIYAGYGPKFAFGIETSANINTNPRTENGCITIGNDIYNFYRNYFDGIVSFKI